MSENRSGSSISSESSSAPCSAAMSAGAVRDGGASMTPGTQRSEREDPGLQALVGRAHKHVTG
eukprot:13853752-Alexandrium_andersonii.AAC.1